MNMPFYLSINGISSAHTMEISEVSWVYLESSERIRSARIVQTQSQYEIFSPSGILSKL